MSTGGVLFEADDFVEGATAAQNRVIILEIKWPWLLDDGCPIKLVARGWIVRRDAKGIALRIAKHEFRTAGARLKKPK